LLAELSASKDGAKSDQIPRVIPAPGDDP